MALRLSGPHQTAGTLTYWGGEDLELTVLNLPKAATVRWHLSRGS
ncbi:hypothetical protein [Deinococcus multiflagellatus]|uniref:Uncharacterized protein n=1 Tax=Deinococcus multiflagellatus TaxID=1656887 RepID=A0ABW1ZNJ6_9DEIO